LNSRIIFTILFCIIWYLILFANFSSFEIEKLIELVGSFEIEKLKELVSKNGFKFFLLIAPLTSLPVLIRNIKVLLIEEKFSFNSTLKTLEKNGNRIAKFKDISKVQIRNIDSEGGDNYRLSIVLKDEGKTLKKKIRIGEGSKKEIYHIAEDIEDIIGIGEAMSGGAGTASNIVIESKIQSPHLKTEITSHSISKTKDQDSKVKPHNNMNSVISLSPEYPKYRNAVIICCVILILIAFVGGGYLLSRHKLKKVKNLIEPTVTGFKEELSRELLEVKKNLSRDEVAKKDYNKTLRINQQEADAYYNQGVTWYNKGKYDRAISDYNKAIEINPKYAKAYNNRGIVWYNKGKYDIAIADYNKTLEINPRDAKAYNNRGVAWYHKGKYDRAISDYTKAIEINPKYANAYGNRGNAYDAKSQYDRACSDFQKACELGFCSGLNLAKGKGHCQ